MAHRAAGLALAELADLGGAQARLQRAVRAAPGDRRVEAVVSLAFVLLERGRPAAALAAVDEVAPQADGLWVARVTSMRALVLQELGRQREALGEYASALTAMQRDHDAAHEARLRNNRAAIHLYRGDVLEAARDLQRAHALFAAEGLRRFAATTSSNLALLAAVEGRTPEALALLARAEEEFDGVEGPVFWLTRADVAMRAGLDDEAYALTLRARSWLQAEGTGWESLSAEAALQLAAAQLQRGEVVAARGEAAEAAGMLRRQRRRSWLALAEYLVVRAEVATGTASSSRVRRVLDALEREGWTAHALDLRLALAGAAWTGGRPEQVLRWLEDLPDDAVARPDVVGRRWHARALLALARGDRRGAGSSMGRAWAQVEARRALAGSTELRALVAGHGEALVALGVGEALRRGAAGEVWRWTERGRAAALRHVATRPPDDPALAAALARARALARLEVDGRLDGERDPALARARARAEEQVRRRSRAARGAASVPVAGADEVRDRLAGAAFVQLHEGDGRLGAVVVAGGRRRLVDLGPAAPAAAAAAAAGFALRRLATGSTTSQPRLQAAAQALEAAVIGPIRRLLGDGSTILCPTPSLASVPWSVVPSLAGAPLSVVPSASLWCRAVDRASAAGGGSGPRSTPRVLAVAGPALVAAAAECRAVVGCYRDGVLLAGAEATVAGLVAALDGTDVLHLAAHGRVRSDNPLFSSVELADGPLTGYDLERRAPLPPVVVMPACDTGSSTAAVGEELLGLAWIVLAAGAASVVAPVTPVPDLAMVGIMTDLHTRLAAGARPAAALAAVQLRARADDRPAVQAAAAALVCGGA